jgi:LacI family transcriptional regulator
VAHRFTVKQIAAQAVESLAARGVPVVTFATDIGADGRIAYVGIDKAAAGRTAAFLLSRFLGERGGVVLPNLGSRGFHGENDRWRGFADFMASRYPRAAVVTIDGGYGLYHATYELARAERSARGLIAGIYSIGGGNRGLLRALDESVDRDVVFVGHDSIMRTTACCAPGGSMRWSITTSKPMLYVRSDICCVSAGMAGLPRAMPAAQ